MCVFNTNIDLSYVYLTLLLIYHVCISNTIIDLSCVYLTLL